MTEECFPLDELDSLLHLSAEDPRRRHLAACPLCRARLASYSAFIAEGPPAPGSQPEKAKADLERFIAGLTQSDAEAKSRSGLHARLRAFRIPRAALAPGLAAAVVVAVVLFVVMRPFSGGDREQPSPLRGLEAPTAGAPALSTSPAIIESGKVTFSWSALPDCDLYRVQLFNEKLEEIACFDADSGTSLTVEGGQMPAPSGPLWWRVVAFRGGDEVARSPLSSINPSER